MGDKNHEITNGTLNFITPDKKTKELKIQDASNDDDPFLKKVFDEKTEPVFYYCNNPELIMRLVYKLFDMSKTQNKPLLSRTKVRN